MVLAKEQKSAIHFKDGPALVLAGPGSGKTTVIVNRIISLIKRTQCFPVFDIGHYIYKGGCKVYAAAFSVTYG